jgi:hypothetical protein
MNGNISMSRAWTQSDAIDDSLQADFPLLIMVSESKITSERPTIRADQLRRNIRKPAELICRP